MIKFGQSDFYLDIRKFNANPENANLWNCSLFDVNCSVSRVRDFCKQF